MKRLFSFFTVAVISFLMVVHVSAEGKIENGKKVKFEYTLTVDGKVVESSEGKQPLEYTQGEPQILPALAAQLEGLKAGDTKKVALSPEEAYGPVDPNAFKEVPKTSLPKDMTPEVGSILQVTAPDGRSFPAMISEIKSESIVLNFNHPLAGKQIHFDIKIVDVN